MSVHTLARTDTTFAPLVMAPFPVARLVDRLRGRSRRNITIPPGSTVEEAIQCLKKANIRINAEDLSIYLSGETKDQAIQGYLYNHQTPKRCSAEHARTLLSYYPLRDLVKTDKAEDHVLSPQDSASILMPLMRWSTTNRNRVEILQMLLEDNGVDPNCVFRRSWPLSYYEAGDLGLVFAQQALHMAAEKGDYVVVEMLLRFHACPSSPDARGDTPLDLATRKRRKNVRDLLESAENGTHVPSVEPAGRKAAKEPTTTAKPRKPKKKAPKRGVGKRRGRVGSKRVKAEPGNSGKATVGKKITATSNAAADATNWMSYWP